MARCGLGHPGLGHPGKNMPQRIELAISTSKQDAKKKPRHTDEAYLAIALND